MPSITSNHFVGTTAIAPWVFVSNSSTGITQVVDGTNPGVQRSGRALTNGTTFFKLTTDHVSLGVPAGATMTSVTLTFQYHVPTYTTGASSSVGASAISADGLTSLQGFSNVTGLAAANATFLTTASNTWTPTGLYTDPATVMNYYLYVQPNTGASNTAKVIIGVRNIAITVNYNVKNTGAFFCFF
ncbi:hypothetical protein AUC43_15350 [Hymenobacter sedentarius]|uniref:Uncharacterized protein n=1 Tax=Hymenobacter sedentarius TaxID=1411621 RepID=A0A0U3T0H2_9BACT|nr:hypothetical protein [Hymenobacter sedentarius]ALW86339.1 hypothetical protein AUC43_15350 [Hymenobacter sedentarius]